VHVVVPFSKVHELLFTADAEPGSAMNAATTAAKANFRKRRIGPLLPSEPRASVLRDPIWGH